VRHLAQDDKDYPQPNQGDRGGRSEALVVQPKLRREARPKNDGFHTIMSDSPNKPPRSPGRRIGARNKVSTALLESFAADFEEHGADVIKLVRLEEPATYLKLAFTLLPQELEVKHDVEASWRNLIGWATQLPNLQARIIAAVGNEAATSLAEETSEPKPELKLPTRSRAADAKRSPSVTAPNTAPPNPPLHDDPSLTFHPPKEPLPQAPTKSYYLGNPNWPTTDGVLDSDRQGSEETGFGRRIDYRRR